MPHVRTLVSVLSATLAVTAGLAVPAASAVASGGSAATVSVTDTGGNPASNAAVGAPLTVTATTPITSPGQTGQQIVTTWNPAQASVGTGSLVTPEGWTTQYTTDGSTWSSSQPADATTIAGIKTSGNVSSNGITNGLQVSTATGSGTVVTGAAHFQGSSGGDGWDAFDAGTHILNIWHHNSSAYNLDCHDKLTGDSCGTVYSVAGYQTSGASTGDVVNGKVYSYVIRNSDATMGVLCTDVSALPFTSCGYVPLVTGPNQYQYIGSQTLVGSKVYAPTTYNGGELLCYDVSTGAGCAGAPYAAAGMSSIGTAPAYTIDAGGDIWVTANMVWCFNDATGAPCAGSWPVGALANGSQSVTPMRDTSGTMTGVCTITTTESCWDLTGTSVTYPATLAAQISTYPVGGLSGYSQFTFNGTRAYWFTGSWGNVTPVACYDWTTNAACAGFQSTTGIAATRYALRFDSTNPNCLWSNGDNGQLASIDANTGQAGCTDPNPTVKIPYTNVVPRLSCAEAGRVRNWQTIVFTAPAGVDVTTLKVAVNDSSNNAIAGFSNLNPDASGTVDLTSLPVSSSGTQPTFLVTVPNVSVTTASQLTAAVTYQSDPPQLCFNLTPNHLCPTLSPGVSSGPTVPVADLVVGGASVATVSGVDSSTTLGADITQAAMSGCLGTVSGTATRTYSGGTAPIGSTEVDLVDQAGATVASADTDNTGAYSFANVNPADYSVQLAGRTQAVTVTANGTAQANVAVPVADPTAADVTTSTLQNTPAAVAVSATVDPVTTLDRSAVKLYDPSTSSWGSSVTVAGEGSWTVTAGGNLQFAPVASFTGTSTAVTYQIADGFGTTATAHATATVLSVLPTAQAVAAAGVQGDTVSLTPKGQSASVPLDPSSLALIDPATGGRVQHLTVPGVGSYSVDTEHGAVVFTPEAGFSGASTVIYQVLDQLGRSATSVMTTTLAPLAPSGPGGVGSGTHGTSSTLTGVPAGSTVTVPSSVANTVSVTLVGSTVTVKPKPHFSGVIRVPVTVTHGSASVTTWLVFTVKPVAVTAAWHTLAKQGGSVVHWKASPNAGQYAVWVNGVKKCVTSSSSCALPGLVGPKSRVTVDALGAGGSVKSGPVAAPYRFTGCVAVGAVHFDTASSALSVDAVAQVKVFGAALQAQGFTHSCLTGYTDGRAGVAYNKALSFRRVHAVGHLLAGWMKHRHMQRVGLHLGYLGKFYPAATNGTDAGRAANRRVTLSLG